MVLQDLTYLKKLR